MKKRGIISDLHPGKELKLEFCIIPGWVSCTLSEFRKGDLIARQGDLCKGLYVLTRGTAAAEMISENGRLIRIEEINAVRPLAPAFIFATDNRFPVDVIAASECEVVFIDKRELISLFTQDAQTLENYLRYNSDKAKFLTDKIMMLSVKTIRGKLAHYILHLYNIVQKSSPGKAVVILDKNQTELSKFFGVSRPALARELGEMEKDGIIVVHGREIRVLNLSKLKEACG
ncbi:MAG: Crp/Fnr family transcriptional regulator [Bacteroidales bacterium]|nr:Crp/Fnr family transcriptional regulator [Bacteroidales bacterium]MDD2424677.1 Crp/Fnr family transcriptional regulator [Bacteroidales bacterium]MDD3989875.1 Crp/Fnr family transcriptional regulator [Bacteroidales bacterium]